MFLGFFLEFKFFSIATLVQGLSYDSSLVLHLLDTHLGAFQAIHLILITVEKPSLLQSHSIYIY